MSEPAVCRCCHVMPLTPTGALFALYYTVCMPTGMPRTEETMPLTITSTVFIDGGEIPSRYTCQGDDSSPPLEWRGVPDTARSLAQEYYYDYYIDLGHFAHLVYLDTIHIIR